MFGCVTWVCKLRVNIPQVGSERRQTAGRSIALPATTSESLPVVLGFFKITETVN